MVSWEYLYVDFLILLPEMDLGSHRLNTSTCSTIRLPALREGSFLIRSRKSIFQSMQP